jgi:hypothetical protein
MPTPAQPSLNPGNEETAMTHAQTQTHKAAAPAAISPEERYDRVAQAAYLRAEHRGFLAGWELQDWLDAEGEIDKLVTQVS